MGVSNLSETDDQTCQQHLAVVRRRMEALDEMEAKMRQMRELAVYAASRTLGEKESAEVQEWVDILRAEVEAIDKETALEDSTLIDFSTMKLDAKWPIH